MINQTITRRFQELEAAADKIRPSRSGDGDYVHDPDFQKWATNVLNLLIGAFGQESPHYRNFAKHYNDYSGYFHEFDAARSIFLAAKEDFEGGYIFNIQRSLSGEVLGDFVSLARLSLKEGYKDVAAVLAAAALEDTLKRYATLNNLSIEDKSMQEVVAALKSKGLVSGAQKTLLDTMPKLRDYAMHANWDKISPEDTSSIIGFVEQFLLTHFSS